MRNPARIYPLLNKIGDYWIKHPELRFGQLIDNIRVTNNGKDEKDRPLFYIEDDEFEKLINKYAKSH